MSITMEETLRLMGQKPEDNPEAFFWHGQALQRSQRIAELQRVVRNLRDAIAELEERLEEAEA